MPTYEYECSACGGATEAFQSMKDAPLRKCPHCGKHRLQRQIGMGAGIIFKGSGFYETDYKRAGEKRDDSPAAPPADKAEAAGPAKESKAPKTAKETAAKAADKK